MIALEGRSGNSEAGFSLVAKTFFLKASIRQGETTPWGGG